MPRPNWQGMRKGKGGFYKNFPRTFACTHSCISYSNAPNTGCPVLGVHVNRWGRKITAICQKHQKGYEKGSFSNENKPFLWR